MSSPRKHEGKLRPGDRHPRAYVGPPDQYDFMGATQFSLLAALGLRAHHSLLDFGCGSLRAGRLLIPYLEPGNYFGIDPNRWLIEHALQEELGHCLVELRNPSFHFGNDFAFDVFGRPFDYLVMQSILSHTGLDLLRTCLESAATVMTTKSRLVLTAIHEEGASRSMPGTEFSGWRYPGCVWFTRQLFSETCEEFGYAAQPLRWFHPRQSWWLLGRSEEALLDDVTAEQLYGFPVSEEH